MRSALALILVACGGAAAPAPPAPLEPAPPVAVAPPPAPPALRLPEGVRPTRGSLELVLDPEVETFSGRASYAITVVAPTPVVWLNATGLVLGKATAGAQIAKIVPGNEDFVGLAFDPPLAAGATELAVEYQGKLDSQKSLGLYRVAEKPGEEYIYSFFEPIDARRAFPCFDEPSAKIPWKLTLHVPAADVALANSAATAETPEDGGKKKVEFAETPPLPSYLVALVVGPFDLVDGGTAGHNGTRLRFAVPRGRGADTRYARSVTPKIVGLLEDFFAIPYPYGKLDVAVVPRYWGTMEHPGLVALGQPLTLIRPEDESVERKLFYTLIAAHELAHYWFGDYVTTAWWDDTWLNEAAAEWTDAKIADAVDASWQLAVDRIGEKSRAMDTDSLPSAKKIRQPVAAKDDIANAFDADITYAKGGAVIHMFEEFLGEERWSQLIHGYLEAHKWGNATAKDFLAALADAAGPEVADGFASFLDQPGFPLVSVSLTCAQGAKPSLALEQRRYLPPGVEAPDESWSFPVCAHWSAGGQSGVACTFLSDKTGNLVLDEAPSCPSWVMANAGGAGYYRVAYDATLEKPLFSAKLPLIERVSFFADVAALAKAGRVPIAQALAAVPALARENERHLVGSAFAILSAVRRDVLGDAQSQALERFVEATFGARARALGLEARKGDSDNTKQQRLQFARVVGFGAQDPQLLRDARRLADRWLDDRKALEPDTVGTVLGLAALAGDRALFDRLVAAEKAAKDSSERSTIFVALGSFRDPALARASLELILDPAFDVRDSLAVLTVRLGPAETRKAAWAWMKAHLGDLLGRMREDEQMRLFSFPRAFCSEEERADVQAALADRAKSVPGAPRELDNALDAIHVCAESQKLNGPEIAKFLAKY